MEAARTCKQRGVRIIASAHGDLRKLLKNKQLRSLVGGVERVPGTTAPHKQRRLAEWGMLFVVVLFTPAAVVND